MWRYVAISSALLDGSHLARIQIHVLSFCLLLCRMSFPNAKNVYAAGATFSYVAGNQVNIHNTTAGAKHFSHSSCTNLLNE
jgi:hypothetical protein